jgi:hypothetical protein
MMRQSKSGRGRSRSWHCGMLVTGAAALALTAAACTSSAQSSSGSTPVEGGTATFALAPSTAANYIFPYISANNQSIANMQDLQFLLYRPLYWFGKGSEPTLNNSLSLAYPPTFSGATVTIRLKHYMWSNGTPVTAQNVMFWLNMELAIPADYGLYTGFPGTVVHDMKAISSTELQMTMNQAYSPTWFLYNELSQVTPMPTAWDRTASGPSSCSTTASDCASVYAYLNDQAKDFSTYVNSPLWSIVDGPWKLSSFSADGHLSFVPNKSYSGRVKPHLAEFKEVPFITAASSTCTDPSLCGPGIPKGKGLDFSFIYATGTAWVASEMQDLQSNAAPLGIKLNLEPKVPTEVTEVAGGNCVSAKLPCDWDMANYGGAWTFFPDYLPTGEDLFICGAIPNSSGFCDKQDNAMIEKTLTSGNLSYMYQWQNYLAPLLPQMWQPLADYQLTEVASNLRGVTPQMPTLDILPENWYFVK